jgi:hypothetical protein
MHTTYSTVAPGDVQAHAQFVLQHHLRLKDHGPKCTAGVLWTVLLYAAARIASLAAACAALRDAPSDTAAHDALLAGLPAFAELQRRLNRALQGDLPKCLRRRRQPLAIDLTLIPYHGAPMHHVSEIYRSHAKSGTTHFHAYATAFVIRRGLRFTVGLTAVNQGEAMANVIQRLLAQAAKAGVRPRYLLLDRGFCSVEVIRYLQVSRRPYLMPVPRRGRKASQGRPPERPQRHADLCELEQERLGTVHHDQRTPTKSDFRGVRQVSQSPGRARTAWQRSLGVCVRRWLAAFVVPLGSGHVPQSVRDRDQLPTVAPGPDQDVHARSVIAAVVYGHCVGAAECVGLAALGAIGSPAPRRARRRLESAAIRSDASLVATCRRIHIGRLGLVGWEIVGLSYVNAKVKEPETTESGQRACGCT